MALVGLDIDSRPEAASGREGHAARKTEELRSILCFYIDTLLARVILAFADGRIGLLVDDIHGDRAGAGELRGAAGEADSDGLGCLIAFRVRSRAIVRIIRLYSDAVRGEGMILIFIASKRSCDFRLVHHDSDGRACGVAAGGRTADAECRIASILRQDGERPCLHVVRIGNMGISLCMNPVAARREGRREFTGSCPCCHDGLDLAGLIRSDGEGAAAVHGGIFERRGGRPFDEVGCDGSAHRRAIIVR